MAQVICCVSVFITLVKCSTSFTHFGVAAIFKFCMVDLPVLPLSPHHVILMLFQIFIQPSQSIYFGKSLYTLQSKSENSSRFLLLKKRQHCQHVVQWVLFTLIRIPHDPTYQKSWIFMHENTFSFTLGSFNFMFLFSSRFYYRFKMNNNLISRNKRIFHASIHSGINPFTHTYTHRDREFFIILLFLIRYDISNRLNAWLALIWQLVIAIFWSIFPDYFFGLLWRAGLSDLTVRFFPTIRLVETQHIISRWTFFGNGYNKMLKPRSKFNVRLRTIELSGMKWKRCLVICVTAGTGLSGDKYDFVIFKFVVLHHFVFKSFPFHFW